MWIRRYPNVAIAAVGGSRSASAAEQARNQYAGHGQNNGEHDRSARGQATHVHRDGIGRAEGRPQTPCYARVYGCYAVPPPAGDSLVRGPTSATPAPGAFRPPVSP